MKHSRKFELGLQQESFLKGFLVGICATAAIGAIGGFVAYRIIKLRREHSYGMELYKFSASGEISPDAAIDITNPSFRDASERIEKNYEMQTKEYADAEEALRHLTDNIS